MGDGADDAFDAGFQQWLDDPFDEDGGLFPRRARRPMGPADEWTTAEGETFKIRDLKTSHLCNILNYVTRECPSRFAGTKKWGLLKKEAKKRGIRRARGAAALRADVSGFITGALGIPNWSMPPGNPADLPDWIK